MNADHKEHTLYTNNKSIVRPFIIFLSPATIAAQPFPEKGISEVVDNFIIGMIRSSVKI